jgi:hypothetical protein
MSEEENSDLHEERIQIKRNISAQRHTEEENTAIIKQMREWQKQFRDDY